MYFKNISNEDLIQFHPVKTRDFMMSLTDVLDSNLFKIEDNDGVYRIFPLFYCDNIKSNNMSDVILENKCIIASRMSDETYFTFTTNGVDGLPVIPSSFLNNTFKGLNDNLTTDEYNKLVYLVRENYPSTDNIRLNKLVNGNYATYHFRSVNDDIGTILDNGILLSDSLKQNSLQVMLSDPSFHYSRHILHLKIYDFGDGDIPFDGDLSNASVTDLSVELVDSEYVDIPLTGEYRYAVIGFDASVEIIHDKPIIPDNILGIDLSVSPVIIQSGEFSEFYATCYDNGRLPVGEGHVIHFFERLEPSITMSASKSIIQSSDNVELYAKVKDEDGSLPKGALVHFYKEEQGINPALDGSENVVSWSTMDNYTGDGVFKTHGGYLDVGWNNIGNWKLEFDYKYVLGNEGSIFKYTGLMPICSADINPFTDAKTSNYAIDTWEGGFSFSGLGRNGWISSPGTSPSGDIQSDWTHLEITKLSDTRLQIVINDTYTWVGEFPNLANLTTLYVGSRDNPSDRNKGGYILFKNIIVS